MAIHNIKTKKVTLDEFFSEQLANASYVDSKFDSSITDNQVSTFKVNRVQLQPISLEDFFMEEGIAITRTTIAADKGDSYHCHNYSHDVDTETLGCTSTGSCESMFYESVVFSNDGGVSGFSL